MSLYVTDDSSTEGVLGNAQVEHIDLSGPSGIKELASGISPTVDIVAIHGLNGHREKSWTAENDILWLRDLLTKELPTARILTYGYSTNTHDPENGYTEHLFSSLTEFRKETQNRPIIFVAHSLGGIILKNALTLYTSSTSKALRHEAIELSTYGIIFLGTPDQITDAADFSQVLLRICSFYSPTNDVIAEHSIRNSEILVQYNSIGERFDTKFFFEGVPTRLPGGEQQMLVPKSVLIVPGEVDAEVSVIDKDHTNMVKFASSDDRDYQLVSRHITNMVSKAPLAITEKWRKHKEREAALDLSFCELQKQANNTTNPLNAEVAEAAIFILQTFAFFHHENIMEGIFERAAKASQKHLCDIRTDTERELSLDPPSKILQLDKDGRWDTFLFKQGIRVLLSFSLIERDPSGPDIVYSVPASVHSWVRGRVSLEVASCFARMVLSASVERSAFSVHNYRRRRTLIPHIKAYLQHAADTGLLRTYNDDEYINFASVYHENGYLKEAEGLQVQVMEDRMKSLGVEHPDTLGIMASLASTYLNQGRWKEAEKLQIQVGDTSTRILGAEHPDTLRSIANLASTYQNQGQWKEAEKLQIQVKDMMTKILGAEHPDTLRSMANLASTYQNQGQWKEAEKLQIHVMETSTKLLGEEHPDTLTNMSNLASTHQNQGQWRKAEKLQVQVKDMTMRILGAEHPNTLRCLGNLALTYQNQGQWEEAEKLQIQVKDGSTTLLGAEHPDTLKSKANLASTYQNQGRWNEAEELELEVMRTRNRSLGFEHPDTLRSMTNLASTYQNQGRWKEAEELQLQVMETGTRVFGAEHPDTLLGIGNLASSYQNLGQLQEAEKLQLQVMDMSTRILGPEHPDTLRSKANLSLTYQNQGRWKEAEKLQIQVIDLSTRLLGAKHPNTLKSKANLASTYQTQERWKEAGALQLEVLKTRTTVLGADHPDTLTIGANLVLTYQSQGMLMEAEALQFE